MDLACTETLDFLQHLLGTSMWHHEAQICSEVQFHMQNKDICKHFAEASTEQRDIQRKYSAVTFYAMETLTRCPISQVQFSHMNKCKEGGALKYTFKYNINKQTNKQINLITIILMQYIA